MYNLYDIYLKLIEIQQLCTILHYYLDEQRDEIKIADISSSLVKIIGNEIGKLANKIDIEMLSK